MDIIVSHTRTDFDAFASMLTAWKLFPQARPFLPDVMIYKLREFMSLYRDVADFAEVKTLRKAKGLKVEHAIVVDTKKRGQLKDFEPFLNRAERISIYDHHPPTVDDIPGDFLELYPYGANTTGLLMELEKQGGPALTPAEATIVLLGIYADTGNLTYPGTKPEDASAAGRLLALGADLKTVNHYLRPYFDPGQRFVFQEMLNAAREIDMQGYKVVLLRQMLEKPQQGMSVLVTQAGDMLGADAIFGVFASEGKPGVQLIFQSHVPEINVGELAAHFDGGGHPGAAAAFLPKADLAGVADTLQTLLTEVPLPTTTVRDMMSDQVFTVPPDVSLKEIRDLLNGKGVHGAPVVDEDGRLIGMISLRDLDRAEKQNALHVPVKGFMSHNVLTVGPDLPLASVRKLISSRNVGRLPVIEDGRLVGIVARSDVLRLTNGLHPPKASLQLAMASGE